MNGSDGRSAGDQAGEFPKQALPGRDPAVLRRVLTSAAPYPAALNLAVPHPAAPDPAAPDPAAPDPDPAAPDPADPDPAAADPVGPDPAGSCRARPGRVRRAPADPRSRTGTR